MMVAEDKQGILNKESYYMFLVGLKFQIIVKTNV